MHITAICISPQFAYHRISGHGLQITHANNGLILCTFAKNSQDSKTESLSKRRFWQQARQPEVNRAVIATKQLDWLPVGVRVVKNVACLSSLISVFCWDFRKPILRLCWVRNNRKIQKGNKNFFWYLLLIFDIIVVYCYSTDFFNFIFIAAHRK